MIVLKTSNFIFFIMLIIFSTICVYSLVVPCNCKNKKRINIYRGKTKYVPVYIKPECLTTNKKNIKKKDNIKNNIKDKVKKEISGSSSIGGHSSTHSGSIVPSRWIDDEDSETDFKFKY